MKKILFFIESLAGGGAEKILSDIVEQLSKEKFDITVMTVSDNGVYVDKVKNCCRYKSFLKWSDYEAGGIRKIKYWILNKLIYTLPTAAVYSHYIKDQYDIEVAFIEGFATKLIAASNQGLRKYAWLHIDMLKNPYSDNFYQSFDEQKNTYKKYDHVFAVSDSVKSSFEKKFGLDNCMVVYNPIPADDIIAKGNEPIDITINPHLQMVTIGRLEHQKGYSRLLKCLDQIDDKTDYSLWIIGGGTLLDELQAYIDDHDLKDKIRLLGYQSNPYKYLSKADAFICSSYAEGFSTAATESLLLGVPVFTVECAGMKELISKNGSGRIVPNTDGDLLKLLQDLIHRPESIKEYKENALKTSEELKNNDRMKRIEDILYE